MLPPTKNDAHAFYDTTPFLGSRIRDVVHRVGTRRCALTATSNLPTHCTRLVYRSVVQ